MSAPAGRDSAAARARPGTLCRACGWRDPIPRGRDGGDLGRCPACRAPRLIAHDELFSLAIAHVDCDAFYASVEKRDRPELRERPLIIGGGRRGVVTTACYIARIHGVRSAMPMARALSLCPEAVVLKPEMAKYVAVSREIRTLFEALTPLVEPLSLDEAFLDLSGTERVHGMPPAAVAARLATRIEREIGVTVSVGLSWNKFLAKIASDLDKPRGMAAIGRAETLSFLEPKPVRLIWGVGAAMEARLVADGFATIGDLRCADPAALARAYGEMGLRLSRLSRGEDDRIVSARRGAKSVSAETTFDRDLAPGRAADLAALDAALWRQCERVSARMKAASLLGGVATLALKTERHKRLTRRRTLGAPSDLAEDLYRAAQDMLRSEVASAKADAPRYRLVGAGYTELRQRAAEVAGETLGADNQQNFDAMLDPERQRRAEAERAVDRLKARFGEDVVRKGRGLRSPHSG
ncbi:MAG: DNA polymerase IV [Pseudomonadota bacterium]